LSLLNEIRKKAAARPKKIVLPESDDDRTFAALETILDQRVARIILIGPDEVRKRIRSKNTKDLEVIDPAKYNIDKLAEEYYNLRKLKGITPEEARHTVQTDYLTFGGLFVRDGLADGFVAGASHTTPDVVRAALRCLSLDRAIGTVSGAFVMEVPNSKYGANGVFVFADCAVNPAPNSRQLAGIAVSSAKLFEQLVGQKARVAFLSYSSKGSAEGELVDKVKDALSRARETAPDLVIDGELQVDSAIVPEVAKIKCPDSVVAGRANVLIFPDLNSGNICYKMTQRLANARAVGPLLQGFTKPASDLSRGCDAEDIVDAVAITSVRVTC